MRDLRLPRSAAAVRDLLEASEVGVEEGLRGTRLAVSDVMEPTCEIYACDELKVIANVRRARPEYGDLGLDAGGRCDAQDFGLVGLVFRYSETVGDALTYSVAFQDLCHPLPLVTERRDGDAVVWDLDASAFPVELRAYLIDQQLAVLSTVWGQLTGNDFRVRSLKLDRPRPDHAHRYGELCGVHPQFEATMNQITIDATLLEEPLPFANRSVMPQLVDSCSSLLHQRHARFGVTGMVLNALESHEGLLPALDGVARELNTSSRSLRRALEREDTSFRALIAEVRLSRAERMLTFTTMTVSAISSELGYGATPAFAAAFRRWTGGPPGAYRQRAQRNARD